MAKSKKVYVATHLSSLKVYELMDRLMNGLDDITVIQNEVSGIKRTLKTPARIYFDSMASVARFFDVPESTVKSAVTRGTSMRNGYKVSRVDVLFNLDEQRGKHLNRKED